MKRINPHILELSKRERIQRQAKRWYASPEGQRHLRICEAFSRKWRRELAELEAECGLRHERP